MLNANTVDGVDFIGFRAKVGIKEITASRIYEGETNMR